MFVVAILSEDSRDNLYFCNENCHTLSLPEVWRRFGERGMAPALFTTYEAADRVRRPALCEVVVIAPPWAIEGGLDLAMLDLASKLLDLAAALC